MWNNVRYILLTAQRDSIFIGLACSIIFGCYVAYFLGSTALAEGDQMSLVYAGGVSRIIVILGLVIFIAFHVRRSFENREIDQMIVRPISREKFIISYWLGFVIIAFSLVCFTFLSICFMTFVTGGTLPNLVNLAIWSFSLFMETLIIVSLAMAASLILRSTVIAVMMCIGFYVLSRIAGFLLLIVTKPGSGSGADKSFEVISTIIPRMDFFSKTEWLVYGMKDMHNMTLFLVQAVIYVGLLLSLAVVDFKKKQF